MRFIGSNSNIDQEIKTNLNIENYTVVSFLESFFPINLNSYKNLILILPYTENTLWDSKKHAWNRLVDDAIYDNLGSCISVFVIEPNLHSGLAIAKILNKVDVSNQVDTIWLYPDRQKCVARRNTEISNLPYQKNGV